MRIADHESITEVYICNDCGFLTDDPTIDKCSLCRGDSWKTLKDINIIDNEVNEYEQIVEDIYSELETISGQIENLSRKL